MDTDDLTIKGSYFIHKYKTVFSANTKLNTADGKLTSNSMYTFTNMLSPISNFTLVHLPRMMIMDGNFKLWNEKDHLFTLYLRSSLIQNEYTREMPTKLHLRYHFGDNYISSFGVESLNPFKSSKPDVISAWGLAGTSINSNNFLNGFKVYTGSYTGISISQNALQFQKFLIGIKNGANLNSYFEYGTNRVNKKAKNIQGDEVDTYGFEKLLSIKLNGSIDKFKLGGDLVYNFNTQNLGAKVFVDYAIDNSTSIKAKLENNKSLIVGLTHNFKGSVNFGVVSKFDYFSGRDGKLNSIKTKFGVTAEFIETGGKP